jgi:hypothetical protein
MKGVGGEGMVGGGGGGEGMVGGRGERKHILCRFRQRGVRKELG